MSEPAAESPSDAPADRIDEFEAELARLRIRSTSPTTEERLLVAGLAAMPIGLLLVVIGYIGASGTTEFSDQIPYLISGGLLGLGLIVIGAVLFLRYSLARFMRFWLLRLIYEERTRSEANVAALDRLADLIVRDRQKETQP
jgi:hypothetical protein